MIPSTVGVKRYLTSPTVDNEVKLTLKHNVEVMSFFTLQSMLQTVEMRKHAILCRCVFAAALIMVAEQELAMSCM